MDIEITPISPPSYSTSNPILLPVSVNEVPVSTVSIQPFSIQGQDRELGRDISISSTTEPLKLVYGSVRTNGVITFAHAAAESSVSAEHLHMVVSIAGHQINDIPNLYLDGEEVTFGGGTIHADARWGLTGTKWDDIVFMSESLGSETQVSNVDLKSQSEANFPGYWTENHRQRGIAYAYLILKFDPDVFVNGLPFIEFGIEGKDDVYDPRDTTYKYTRNAALIIADYLTNTKLGLGADYSTEIDETNLIEAANICDESVSILPSGSESRYTIDGVIDTSQSPRSILQDMSSAIAGPIVYSEGKWKIFPGEYRTPAITLTEDDLRSDIKLQTKQSRRATFNAIKGTHRNADGKTVDFPAVRNATYEAEDGDEVLWRDISLPLTRTASAAQRISKIALEDNRQDIILEANFGLKAFQLAAEDNVYVTLDRFGFSSKVFRVIKWKPVTVDGKELQVALTLKETASEIYTWSTEETTVDVAPNTTLPDPSTVTAPANLTLDSGTEHLYLRSDGTVFSRIKASWDAIADPYVTSVEVEYKKSTAGNVDSGFADFSAASSQYLSRANGSLTGLNNGDEDFTIGLWYRQNGATSVGGIASMAGGSSTDRRYGIYNQSGTLYLEMFDDAGGSVYPGYAITQGTWYFVVATYEQSTRSVKLYANGSLVDSATLASATNVSTADFRIGSYLTANYGECSLKNVFAMSSVIQSSHMTHIYNSGDGRAWQELNGAVVSSIGSWWGMSEESGTRYDRGPWGNDLTDNNSVGYTAESSDTEFADFKPATIVSGNQTNVYILDVEDGENYDVRVRSVNGYGNKSSWTNELFHTVVGKTAAPSDVTNLASSVDSYGIRLTWDQIPDKDLSHYVIKNSDTVLAVAFTNSFTWEIQTAATYNIAVYAVDTSGNVSDTEATLNVTIANPGIPAVTATIDGTDVVLSWPEVAKAANGFAIDAYEISYGSTYGASTALNETKSSQFRTRVSWGDTRKFWVVARDVAGNTSTETSVDVDVAVPSAPTNFAANVIDNNVALSWDIPAAGSLPVTSYKLYRGDAYGSATSLGKVTATFKTIFETAKGTYTYWLTAFDSADNESDPVSLTAVVISPPDYILNDDAQVIGEFCETTNVLVGTRDTTIEDYDIAALSPTLWLKADEGVTVDSSGRVSSWADQSGNGFDFTQSTDAAKPIQTTTGAENFLLQSEDFTTTWTAGRVSRAANQTTDPLGTTLADSIIASTENNSHYVLQNYDFTSGVEYRFSVFAKQLDAGGGGHHIALRLDNAAMPNNSWATFDLVNGTADATTGNGASAEIEDVDGGWYRCTLIQTANATATAGAVIYPTETGDSTSGVPDDWVFAGDGSDGVYLWGAQLNTTDAPKDYVATLEKAALRGVNGKPTIRFDGSDDQMISTATMGDFINADEFTVIIAATIHATTSNSASYNNHAIIGTTSGAMNVHARTDNKIYTGIYNAGDYAVAPSTAATLGEAFIYTSRLDSGNIYADLNRGTEASLASPDASGLSNICFLGRDDDASDFLEMDALEILVFDTILTDAQRFEVERYLNYRWLPREDRYTNLEETGNFILPIDVTATLSDNVTDSGGGNTTFDDMIADGYTFPFQPTPGTCEIQRVIDYGTTLSSSLITLSWNKTNINSNVDFEAQIDYSSDGTSWTSATAGAKQVFASSFRYVRVTITGTPDDDKSFAKLENVRVRLDVKETREVGIASAAAADGSGTTVSITKNFIDISSISGSVKGSTFGSPTFTWTDPNPTEFKVYLFDAAGSRIDGDVSYTITGVESND